MAYQELPAETKFQIASYCTPLMLSSLALVASDMRPEAEETLYSSIAVSADRIESLQHIFETLATNPQKAGFVRFITLEAMAMNSRDDRSVETNQTYIAGQALLVVLPKLISLTDLRLKFNPSCCDPLRNELESVLKAIQRAVRVQLHTVFYNNWFDVADLLMNQRNVQLLGVYHWNKGLHGPSLQLLQHLRRESIVNPLIFSVGDILMPSDPHLRIGLFPAFQTARMDGILSRVLKPAIDRDRGTYAPLDCDSIGELNLFFETLEDTDYVSRYILDAAQCFPNIKILMLWAQRSSKLVAADIMTIITPLRHLEKLYFKLYMVEEEEIVRKETDLIIDKKTKSAYARQWEAVCPELETVYFYRGPPARRFSRWAVWDRR